jgi:hypothetical protein
MASGEPGFQFLRKRAQMGRQVFTCGIDVSKLPPNLLNREPPAERHLSFSLHLSGVTLYLADELGLHD